MTDITDTTNTGTTSDKKTDVLNGDNYITPVVSGSSSNDKNTPNETIPLKNTNCPPTSLDTKSLADLTRETKRDFFNRSDRTVFATAKNSLEKLHPDTKLIVMAYMHSLIDVTRRDLADSTPMRYPEIKYECPVYFLGASRDLEYVKKKCIYYTVYEHEIQHVCNVLRYRIRQKYGTKEDPERFIEVIVRTVPKTFQEYLTTLPTTRVIEVFVCNVTQVYPSPAIHSRNHPDAGINTI